MNQILIDQNTSKLLKKIKNSKSKNSALNNNFTVKHNQELYKLCIEAVGENQMDLAVLKSLEQSGFRSLNVNELMRFIEKETICENKYLIPFLVENKVFYFTKEKMFNNIYINHCSSTLFTHLVCPINYLLVNQKNNY